MEYKTGLWRKTAASGVTYYFGQKGGIKVTIFKNQKRDGHENDPDLSAIVEVVEEGAEPAPVNPDDDIPF